MITWRLFPYSHLFFRFTMKRSFHFYKSPFLKNICIWFSERIRMPEEFSRSSGIPGDYSFSVFIVFLAFLVFLTSHFIFFYFTAGNLHSGTACRLALKIIRHIVDDNRPAYDCLREEPVRIKYLYSVSAIAK